MISKIDRSVLLNIGGEERRLKFTVGALEELESYLPSRNIYKQMQDIPFAFGVLATAVWIGLKWQDKKLRRETVLEWINEYNSSNEASDLFNKTYAAIGLSGMFGSDVSVFAEIANTDSPEEPGKSK